MLIFTENCVCCCGGIEHHHASEDLNFFSTTQPSASFHCGHCCDSAEFSKWSHVLIVNELARRHQYKKKRWARCTARERRGLHQTGVSWLRISTTSSLSTLGSMGSHAHLLRCLSLLTRLWWRPAAPRCHIQVACELRSEVAQSKRNQTSIDIEFNK